MKNSIVLLILCVAILLGACQGCNLSEQFYEQSCPNAESIVRDLIWKKVSTNPRLPAALLRMHFHDCFVRGCDGSVLINSTSNNTAEKDAIPNRSLSGFDVIEEIKAELEKTCPNTVSCADILALAARDSVSFQYQTPMWEVLTGRRDGRVSLASEALAQLPSPFQNFTSLNQSFASKNLTAHDLVVLSGGHTIGRGHCNTFSPRLYNFTGKGDQDPSLNSTYACFLKAKCSPTDNTTTVEMDPNSSQNFDTNYYTILLENKGLFVSDAALLTNEAAKNTVVELVNTWKFFAEFGQSMMRMGQIEVLTGTSGEIRKVCSKIN